MSTFTCNGTSATFTVLETGFADKGGGASGLEEWTFDVEVDSSTIWGALFSCRSWNVSQRPIPGGNTVYVDIGGGAGQGFLQVDNLDSHNAILTAVSRKAIEPGTLRSVATVTFLITS